MAVMKARPVSNEGKKLSISVWRDSDDSMMFKFNKVEIYSPTGTAVKIKLDDENIFEVHDSGIPGKNKVLDIILEEKIVENMIFQCILSEKPIQKCREHEWENSEFKYQLKRCSNDNLHWESIKEENDDE